MTLIVRQQADDDVTAMTARIAANSPRTALRFVDRLNRTFRLLESMPLLGSLPPAGLNLPPGTRFMTMRRYHRVVIVYLPLPDGVEIVRVVEGNRDLATLLADP
jgi:toxin ParE1/3/4